MDERPHHFRNAGVALLVALGIYAAFYSSFGSNPHGLVDGVTTYLHQFRRSGDATHAHPFSHYASLLWPHRSGGVRWGLLPLLLAAAVGLIAAARPAAPRALQLTAAVSVLLFLLYSLIPYKTPWLLLTPLLGAAVLAGAGLAALASGKAWRQLLAAGTACVIVVHLVGQTRLALERYPGDARNPYFYQQTPRGFSALPRRLAELASFDPQIAVVSPDFAWPLPWYLRNEDKVAYFSEPPANLQDFDAWVWDSQLPAPDAWPDGAMIELHGARPNVLLQLVVRPELRQQWESTVR